MKNRYKILICIFAFLVIAGLNIEQTNAYHYCSESEISTYQRGAKLSESLQTCVCDTYSTNSDYLSKCKDMTMKRASANGNTVKVYKYNLEKINNETGAATKYSEKMNELIGTIKGIINASIGVIIFILGFGFIWNITNLGISSSNPQQRQICIKKIGDVFATAMFIGMIPLIMELIVSIMMGVQS